MVCGEVVLFEGVLSILMLNFDCHFSIIAQYDVASFFCHPGWTVWRESDMISLENTPRTTLTCTLLASALAFPPYCSLKMHNTFVCSSHGNQRETLSLTQIPACVRPFDRPVTLPWIVVKVQPHLLCVSLQAAHGRREPEESPLEGPAGAYLSCKAQTWIAVSKMLCL